MNDTPAEEGVRLDLVGTALSALGLGLIVFGILKSGTWGFVQPKPEAPEWLGLSPVIWMLLAAASRWRCSCVWESRRVERGQGALIDPSMLRNLQLRNGVISFLFMFLVQAGMFFAVPLFLSVALGLSAIETGVRLLAAVADAAAVRRRGPEAVAGRQPAAGRPLGFVSLFAGLVLLVALLDVGVGPGDHHRAAAARGRRPRRDGLAARAA